MKENILLLFIFFTSFSYSQKQGNIWYFGEHAGLDFNNGSPVAIVNGQTGNDIPFWLSQEGTSCISDSAGDLLFYTSSKTIWNKYHTAMPNGSGLMGGASSTQSSLIIPLPESDELFYVFTCDEFQSYTSLPERGYRYSIVDMCLDNKKGDVIPNQKNILLLPESTEKLAACQDSAGTGYWIMGHKMFSDEFRAWHLTTAGITDTVVSNIGTIHGYDSVHAVWSDASAQGQMKFNFSGTMMAVAIGNSIPAIVDLFDFNPASGTLSNCRHMKLDSALHKSVYGIEFSPDGNKLYTSVTGGSGGKRVYQFDITAGGGNRDSIIASRITLFQSNSNSLLFGMQYAPNGKIYVVGNSGTDLSCINFPNATGAAADYDSSAVMITGINSYTLPSFIAGYKYHNVPPKCLTTKVEYPLNKNEIVLQNNTPNPYTEQTIINYFVPLNSEYAQIIFLDQSGKLIKVVDIAEKGKGQLNVFANDLSNGIYTYSLIVDGKTLETKKMVKQ